MGFRCAIAKTLGEQTRSCLVLEEVPMDGSSSSNGNPRNGKRAAQSLMDHLREPKRGVGIAKLEKMRVEEEMMKEKYLDPFSRAHISGPGIAGFQGRISYPYGPSRNMSGLFIVPSARPPISTYGAASNVKPRNTAPRTRTLELFPDLLLGDEHADSKRDGNNHNLSLSVKPTRKNPHDQEDRLDLSLKLAEPTCKNPKDQEDLDLDLKL